MIPGSVLNLGRDISNLGWMNIHSQATQQTERVKYRVILEVVIIRLVEDGDVSIVGVPHTLLSLLDYVISRGWLL